VSKLIVTYTKTNATNDNFWEPSNNYLTYRKSEFIDTGKITSLEVSYLLQYTSNTRIKTATTSFNNITSLNEWVATQVYIDNKNNATEYNSTNGIAVEYQIIE